MIFPKKRDSTSPQLGNAVFRAGVIGLHPLSGLLVGGGIGYVLWHHFDTPWCFWLFLFLGFVAGCRNAYSDIKRILLKNDESNAEQKPSGH